MRFACQDNLVPGATPAEKLDALARLGFAGVEIQGRQLLEPQAVQEWERALRGHSVRAASICAGFRGSLLDPDPAVRRQAADDIRHLLSVAGHLGCTGLIVVPIFGPPRVPDLSPWRTAVEIEEELLLSQLGDLAEHARQAGTHLLLEPLNRYETHLYNRLEQAAVVVRRLGHPGVALMADFFHMNIEEADIASALAAAGPLVAHVHLADSNRKVPGRGHTDFRSGFGALKAQGYRGWAALECRVDPPALDTLAGALRHLEAAWAAA